tara:strand:+ start:5635 stop:5862 length:228 start_codon:yes stop_codon:yes gene_type:complete
MWMTANLIVLVSILKGDKINQHRTQSEEAARRFLNFLARMIARAHAKGGANPADNEDQQNEPDDKPSEPAHGQGA